MDSGIKDVFERMRRIDEQAPDKLFCVCKMEGGLQDLKRRELSGLEGLSANAEAVIDGHFTSSLFSTQGQMVLVTDFGSAVSENNLEAVRYEDAEYLIKNNFGPLSRITAQPDRAVIRTLRKFDKTLGNQGGTGELRGVMKTIDTRLTKRFLSNNVRVNSVDEFVDWVVEQAKEFLENNPSFSVLGYEVSPDDVSWDSKQKYVESMREAILRVADDFEDEQEWLVQGPGFQIPDRTVLIVDDSEMTREFLEAEGIQGLYEYRFASGKSEAIKIAESVSV